MVRILGVMIVASALAACASNPKARPEPAPQSLEKSCDQADWQAETNPVLNKRSGPDGMDKYETQTPAKEHGCP